MTESPQKPSHAAASNPSPSHSQAGGPQGGPPTNDQGPPASPSGEAPKQNLSSRRGLSEEGTLHETSDSSGAPQQKGGAPSRGAPSEKPAASEEALKGGAPPEAAVAAFHRAVRAGDLAAVEKALEDEENNWLVNALDAHRR
ncbi:hypothetical protein ACSSS7_002468 [Eimeria intestinalis]